MRDPKPEWNIQLSTIVISIQDNFGSFWDWGSFPLKDLCTARRHWSISPAFVVEALGLQRTTAVDLSNDPKPRWSHLTNLTNKKTMKKRLTKSYGKCQVGDFLLDLEMGGMSFSDYLIHLSSLHVPLGEEHVRTHPWHHLPGFRRSSKWCKEVVRSGGSSLESVFGLPWGWSSQLKLAAQPTASWCWTGSETQKRKTLKNVGNSESKREEFHKFRIFWSNCTRILGLPTRLGPNTNCTDSRQWYGRWWTNQIQSCLEAQASIGIHGMLTPWHRNSWDRIAWRSSTAGSCSSRTSLPDQIVLWNMVKSMWRAQNHADPATWADLSVGSSCPTSRCPPKCNSGEWKLRTPWDRQDFSAMASCDIYWIYCHWSVQTVHLGLGFH